LLAPSRAAALNGGMNSDATAAMKAKGGLFKVRARGGVGGRALSHLILLKISAPGKNIVPRGRKRRGNGAITGCSRRRCAREGRAAVRGSQPASNGPARSNPPPRACLEA